MGTPAHAQAFLAARKWQEQFCSKREYSVVRDGDVFSTGLVPFTIPRSEFAQAHLLKHQLIRRHEGTSVEELFMGREIDTSAGVCYCISSEIEMSPGAGNPDGVMAGLREDLTLCYGIGKQTEAYLKRRGYASIPLLLRHPRFGGEAKRVLSILENGNTEEIIGLLVRGYAASHTSVLRTSFLHTPEEMVFFDIETLGLFSRPIILFGLGTFEGGRLVIRQYLLRDIEEEEAAITALLQYMNTGRTLLVTFNGKAFDMPYLRDRCAYHRIANPPGCPHYDMLHFSRREWKKRLPDCRLQTIEQGIYGMRRVDDVPSAMVPEFYAAYLESGNPGPLVPIVQHNRDDIATLVRIFSTLRMRGE
jgi:uncharacterized protein YprB with RNaseH-like and TPR domain